jgi:hypothetical protein
MFSFEVCRQQSVEKQPQSAQLTALLQNALTILSGSTEDAETNF